MISFKSVKFRLTLWYAFILTVLLSVFAFFMYAEFSRVLYQDVDKKLQKEANAFEATMSSYFRKIFRDGHIRQADKDLRDPFQYTPVLRLRVENVIEDWQDASKHLKRSTHLVRFVGLDHQEFLSNLKGWEQEIIFPDFERDNTFMETGKSFQTIYFQGKPIRLYYHLVRHSSRALFLIQEGIPIDEVGQTLSRLRFTILVSIPGAVLMACIAGWFLARRFFRPIDYMIREARQITATYLKGRLPRTKTGDEIDRLAETLNEMMDRLEISTRAIQDFSSDISHELKTPLAIIRGEIDLALRRDRSVESLKDTLSVIGEEVNELIRLVDDLMILVRSDSNQLVMDKKEMSLEKVLDYEVSRFHDRAFEKGVELSLASEEDISFSGDQVYLKRLFSNLIDNAIKFTPKGGYVMVILAKRNKQAVVEVKDSGMGIDAEMREKVFSRFYRTDQARSQEGAGLGLNIAKAICEAHHANIDIQPNQPKGTRVIVYFDLPI